MEKSFSFSADTLTGLQKEAEQVKAKHKVKRVFVIDVEDPDNEDKYYRAWLSKPDLKVLSAFYSVGQNDPIQASKMVFNGCFLEGDKEIVQNDEIFAAAMAQIEDLMKVTRSRIAKF
jgi:hypothetical protein